MRDHLSRYLEVVREGQEVTVTDHGKAVARLVPLDQPRLLDRLIAEGLVTQGRTPKRQRVAKRVVAKARRMRRITPDQLSAAVDDLDSIMTEIDFVEVTAELALTAGELAQVHGLRGYEAAHLAAALAVADAELVLVSGDADLANAAVTAGSSVITTT